MKEPIIRHLIVGQGIWDSLKATLQEAKDEKIITLPFATDLGIQVIVEDDPEKRKSYAWCRSLVLGKPTAYQDEEGNIVTVSLPKADPIFPACPMSFLGKNPD